jgi:RNA polymerase sigma factor (sigma-70 family)
MDQRQIHDLLRGLHSRRPQEAWEQFLQEYSSPILRVIHFHERDPDHVSDCFVFVCEQLTRNRFRRLCQFRTDGLATFPTWLRAVVRHLCIDWRRRQFGRYRIFQSVAKLSGFDQAVFQLLYEQEVPPEESFMHLTPLFPGTTKERFIESVERIQDVLTARQRWLLSVRSANTCAVKPRQGEEEVSLAEQISDRLPDPEVSAARTEERNALLRALSCLSEHDRLLIRLRFEQDLTLEQVARVMKLGDPQSADRYVRHVLEQLRQSMTRSGGFLSGKPPSMSVK